MKFFRLAGIGLVVVLIGGAFAYTGGWLTPDRLTPARFIDEFERINGVHAGFRRNHAKGVCAAGFFEGNGNAASLSSAGVFGTGRVPVIGRFALAVGRPNVMDSDATVRSMALLFELPDGEQWRTGMNAMPVFAVNTPQAFYDQLSTGGDPQKLRAFLAKHPETLRALQEIGRRPISSGFENTTFNSLNAFRFVNAAGTSTAVRWSMIPEQPFEAPGAHSDSKSFLFDALMSAKMPLLWKLVITVAQPGDPTNDATLAWPENRQHIDAGTLTIDKIVSEDQGQCRDVNYDPLILPKGIAPSDDPLLSARSAAYSQSFTRRVGEKK